MSDSGLFVMTLRQIDFQQNFKNFPKSNHENKQDEIPFHKSRHELSLKLFYFMVTLFIESGLSILP